MTNSETATMEQTSTPSFDPLYEGFMKGTEERYMPSAESAIKYLKKKDNFPDELEISQQTRDRLAAKLELAARYAKFGNPKKLLNALQSVDATIQTAFLYAKGARAVGNRYAGDSVKHYAECLKAGKTALQQQQRLLAPRFAEIARDVADIAGDDQALAQDLQSLITEE